MLFALLENPHLVPTYIGIKPPYFGKEKVVEIGRA
jgi:hypothetical protein